LGEVGGEVSLVFGVCGKRLVPIEGDMVDESTEATIVKVHGVDVCNRNATNSIDDYIVFVAGGGADGEVAGLGYAEEYGAGIGGRSEC
jgi:hypothetical protein